MKIISAGGGTNYVPPLEEMVDLTNQKPVGFFGKIFGSSPSASQEDPVYLGFITDGEPNDKRDTIKFIESTRGTRNFIQIIAIGRDIDESFLRDLAKYENVDYIIIPNPTSITVESFYEALANKKLLEWTKSL